LHDGMANKVIALLDKAPREPRRVLLIGGVTQNAAMVAALRGKRPALEFVVRPESAWFEAWGCALLTRDEPRHRRPQITPPRQLDRLPPLGAYQAQVHMIAAPATQAVRERKGRSPRGSGAGPGACGAGGTVRVCFMRVSARSISAPAFLSKGRAGPGFPLRGFSATLCPCLSLLSMRESAASSRSSAPRLPICRPSQ
jgi:hypothetical protein